MINKLFYSAFFTLFILSITPTQAVAEPLNLGLLKKELVTYHDSGVYLQEIQHVIQQATQYIQQEAETNARSAHPEKLAIVLDIDETSLSNFSNMKQIDFANLPATITQQLLAADEPAIQPTLDLYQYALQHNIAVFFVTGRDQSLATATAQNLRAAGYETWAGLELRHDTTPTIPYKTAARAKITQQGYTIIASIGDQESDLIGGYAKKTFKLPNPFYYLP